MLITAVGLAVLAVAMVAVCEHTEVCRLRYRVWRVQQRHDSLLRQIREIDAEIEEGRTPKRLLEDRELEVQGGTAPLAAPRRLRESRPFGQDGRRDTRWFEFDGGVR